MLPQGETNRLCEGKENRTKMHVQLEYVSDLARALERQVEIQAEAAKQAIR